MTEILHVEVCQRIDSTLSREEIEKAVNAELRVLEDVELNMILFKDSSNHILKNHVESILCSRDFEPTNPVHINEVSIQMHIYRLEQGGAATETMQEGDSDELPVALHWVLPSEDFHGLWENLYFDSDIKENLLNFAQTTVLFSDRKIDANIISWNRVVLLHGPPGTGKTSLSKALAHKLAIRLGDRYTHGELVEINSHSLFSKWFSESGKLVMKMFGEIKRLLENPKALVCVLIDEVESLAHARKSSCSGTEPSDSIRVVNALLSQLDQIKRHPNILILTTSNVTEAIDLAFVDRADIKQYIGHPSEVAIYKIYSSCLRELMKAKITNTEVIYEISSLEKLGEEGNSEIENSRILWKLSRESVGLSGRTLRKIPFLAHALYIQSSTTTLRQFLIAMELTVKKHKLDCLE